MALTVEDGSGVENADALVDVEFVDTYAARNGYTDWEDADEEDEKEPAIRRGTLYVMGKYRGLWSGTRTFGRDQVFDFPRKNATDSDGEEIGEDEIPIELQQAIAEASIRERRSPFSLTPDVVASAGIKRTKDVLGPLESEVEYVQAAGAAVRPEVQIIDELLAPLFNATTGGARTVFITRA